MRDSFIELFTRDLDQLKVEISLYGKEDAIWIVKPGILNSSGTLCLHLVGNLNHFVGAVFGNSGFIRNRDTEFSSRNVLRTKMIEEIDITKGVIANTLNGMNAADFAKSFPLEKHGKIVTTEFMLMHLLTHFSYHLGQINYHRRIVEGAES